MKVAFGRSKTLRTDGSKTRTKIASSTQTSRSAISRHPAETDRALPPWPSSWRFDMRVARFGEFFGGMGAAYDGALRVRLAALFVAHMH